MTQVLRYVFYFSMVLTMACGGGSDNPPPTPSNNNPNIDSFIGAPNPVQPNVVITFSWTITDSDGDALSCTLDAGDGSAVYTITDCGNSTSQEHTYTATGPFTASLNVVDGNGGSHNTTFSVTVSNNTPPNFSGAFTVSHNPAQVNIAVNFNWSVTDADGDTVRCDLDVDDDGTADYTFNDCANANSQSHTYTVDNDYTARLTADDGNGGVVSQTIEMQALTNVPPQFDTDLSVDVNNVAVNSPVTFSWAVSDIAGDNLTCRIDVDNDGTDEYTINDCASVTEQQHTYADPGSYTAKITIDDGNGGIITQTIPITVVAGKALGLEVIQPQQPAVTSTRNFFSIVVSNPSASSVSNITVNLTVPNQVSFTTSRDAEPDVTRGCEATNNTTCQANEIAVWEISQLDPGESAVIDVNLLVTATNGTNITVPVSVSGLDITTVSVNKTIGVNNAQDAELILSTKQARANVGDEFVYHIDAGNLSGAGIINPRIQLSLPSGVTPVNSAQDGATLLANGDVEWDAFNLNTIPARGALQRELRVRVDSAIAGEILSARAVLSYDNAVVDNISEHALTVGSPFPLSVDISALEDPVIRGDRALYKLTVSNHSGGNVDLTSVVMRLPTEMSFDIVNEVEPVVNDGCQISGPAACQPHEEAIWNLGTLAAGETRHIHFDAAINGTITSTPGELLELPIRIKAANQSDVNLIKVVRIDPDPQAELILSSKTNRVSAGGSFTYQIDVGNRLSNAGLINPRIRLKLPPGVTAANAAQDGATILPNGDLQWDAVNLGNIAFTGGLQRQLRVNVDAGVVASSILAARATLSHNGAVMESISEHAVTVDTPFPLSVDISVLEDSVIRGERALYTLTIGNPSGTAINQTRVMLRMPTELSFNVKNEVEPDVVDTGCTTSSPSTCQPGEEAVWDLGTLAAGEFRTISIDAVVVASAVATVGELIELPIHITAQGQNEMNTVKVVRVESAPAAELILSTQQDRVLAAGTFTYQIDVGNRSNNNMVNPELRLRLPPGVTPVDAAQDGATVLANGDVQWDAVNLGNITTAGALRRRLTVDVDAGAQAGEILAARAVLSYDNRVVERSSETAVIVSADFPLQVNMSVAEDSVIRGERSLYTLTIGNPSNNTVNLARVMLRMPTELSFDVENEAEPNVTDVGCTTASPTTCQAGEEAVWDLGSLVAGESRTITFDAVVNATATSSPGELIELPIRIMAQNQNDLNLVKVVRVETNPAAELILSANSDPVSPGGQFVYHIDIGNRSGSVLANPSVQLRLPPGVTAVDAAQDGATVLPTGEIVWDSVNLGSIAAADSLHRELSVTVSSGSVAGEVLSAEAALNYDNVLIENVSDYAVTVGSFPLNVSFINVTDPVSRGGQANFTIRLENPGQADVNLTTVKLRLPGELSFDTTAANPVVDEGCLANNLCSVGEEATWNLTTIGTGAPVDISVSANVNATANTILGELLKIPVRIETNGGTDVVHKILVIRAQ